MSAKSTCLIHVPLLVPSSIYICRLSSYCQILHMNLDWENIKAAHILPKPLDLWNFSSPTNRPRTTGTEEKDTPRAESLYGNDREGLQGRATAPLVQWITLKWKSCIPGEYINYIEWVHAPREHLDHTTFCYNDRGWRDRVCGQFRQVYEYVQTILITVELF